MFVFGNLAFLSLVVGLSARICCIYASLGLGDFGTNILFSRSLDFNLTSKMARFIVLAIVFLMVSCVFCSDHDDHDDDDHDHDDFNAVEFCSARLAPGVNETHFCHPDDTSCGVVCKRDGVNVTGTIVHCDEDKDQFYSATAKVGLIRFEFVMFLSVCFLAYDLT